MKSLNQADFFNDQGLASPFYRVSVKAIIRDPAGRVLAVADGTGTFELPGGGWEHEEDFEVALRREIEEELGATVESIGPLSFAYRGRDHRPFVWLRIVTEATLRSQDFRLDEDEVTEARFVDREEFLALNWCDLDKEVLEHIDKIWPPVEKVTAKQ
jgi:8-oxo-dGTP pyrophosphatase MutT (NUDIX family)